MQLALQNVNSQHLLMSAAISTIMQTKPQNWSTSVQYHGGTCRDVHSSAMGTDQQNWDESPCLPLVHELESLHCSAQLLSPGLQLLVHSLSLIYTVCNLLQISLGDLRMNHTRCHMIGLMHMAKTHSRRHT